MADRLSTALRNLLVGASGLSEAMDNGIIYIYSGPQPASADDAETGTLLAKITVASGAFVSGQAANGLSFGTPASGAVAKAAEVWSGVGLAAGIAGWYRFYANTVVQGAVTTTGVRMDGACTSGQFAMSSTNIAVGATITVDTAVWTMPAG